MTPLKSMRKKTNDRTSNRDRIDAQFDAVNIIENLMFCCRLQTKSRTLSGKVQSVRHGYMDMSYFFFK